MDVAAYVDEVDVADEVEQVLGRVAPDLEARAVGGAVFGEGADDEPAAGREGAPELTDVDLAVIAVKEVEHGAVMPEVPPARGLPGEEILLDPPDGTGLREASTCRDQSDLGQVEDGNVLMTAGQEMVDERGGAAADVDDGLVDPCAERVEESE
jgi:hypothetical protein